MAKTPIILIGAGIAGAAIAYQFLPAMAPADSLFSVNSSPYGKALATTYGRPIDMLDHNGRTHDHGPAEQKKKEAPGKCSDPDCGQDHDHHPAGQCEDPDCDQHHEEAAGQDGCPGCESERQIAALQKAREQAQASLGKLGDLAQWLGKVDTVLKAPTNATPMTSAHYVWLRRKLEQTVRHAYELDPLNFTHFNSLHFFYTTPVTVARYQVTDQAKVRAVCQRTIDAISSDPDNPVGWLTVAAARQGYLLSMAMAGQRENYSAAEARQQVEGMGLALKNYDRLAAERIQSGAWVVGSPRYADIQRIELEMKAAYKMCEGLPEAVNWGKK